MTAETDPATVIVNTLKAHAGGGHEPKAIAAIVLKALDQAGFVVMAPQDITWGECPENWDSDLTETDPHPHEVSLDLCKWCLQYNPE